MAMFIRNFLENSALRNDAIYGGGLLGGWRWIGAAIGGGDLFFGGKRANWRNLLFTSDKHNRNSKTSSADIKKHHNKHNKTSKEAKSSKEPNGSRAGMGKGNFKKARNSYA